MPDTTPLATPPVRTLADMEEAAPVGVAKARETLAARLDEQLAAARAEIEARQAELGELEMPRWFPWALYGTTAAVVATIGTVLWRRRRARRS